MTDSAALAQKMAAKNLSTLSLVATLEANFDLNEPSNSFGLEGEESTEPLRWPLREVLNSTPSFSSIEPPNGSGQYHTTNSILVLQD